MSKYIAIIGTDTYEIDTGSGQPESQVRVDGEATPYQCADGSCRTARIVRMALAYALREDPSYEDTTAEERNGDEPERETSWDDVSYDAAEG